MTRVASLEKGLASLERRRFSEEAALRGEKRHTLKRSAVPVGAHPGTRGASRRSANRWRFAPGEVPVIGASPEKRRRGRTAPGFPLGSPQFSLPSIGASPSIVASLALLSRFSPGVLALLGRSAKARRLSRETPFSKGEQSVGTSPEKRHLSKSAEMALLWSSLALLPRSIASPLVLPLSLAILWRFSLSLLRHLLTEIGASPAPSRS